MIKFKIPRKMIEELPYKNWENVAKWALRNRGFTTFTGTLTHYADPYSFNHVFIYSPSRRDLLFKKFDN